MAPITVKEVLEKAIEKEIASQRLYYSLGRQVKEPPVREAFRELVAQEEGHQRLLEQYLRGELGEGGLDGRTAIDYRIAERLDLPDISSDMKLADVFLLAANREKSAHEFYLDFGRLHPAGKVKALINRLALEELEHKRRVERLYTEVAFPQTDGG